MVPATASLAISANAQNYTENTLNRTKIPYSCEQKIYRSENLLTGGDSSEHRATEIWAIAFVGQTGTWHVRKVAEGADNGDERSRGVLGKISDIFCESGRTTRCIGRVAGTPGRARLESGWSDGALRNFGNCPVRGVEGWRSATVGCCARNTGHSPVGWRAASLLKLCRA